MVDCPECGSTADLTPDKTNAHCASCNNIFEPDKPGSSEKGSGSGSGDKEAAKGSSDGDKQAGHQTKS